MVPVVIHMLIPAENPARRTPSFQYRTWNLDPEVKAFRGRILGEQPQPVNAPWRASPALRLAGVSTRRIPSTLGPPAKAAA